MAMVVTSDGRKEKEEETRGEFGKRLVCIRITGARESEDRSRETFADENKQPNVFVEHSPEFAGQIAVLSTLRDEEYEALEVQTAGNVTTQMKELDPVVEVTKRMRYSSNIEASGSHLQSTSVVVPTQFSHSETEENRELDMAREASRARGEGLERVGESQTPHETHGVAQLWFRSPYTKHDLGTWVDGMGATQVDPEHGYHANYLVRVWPSAPEEGPSSSGLSEPSLP